MLYPFGMANAEVIQKLQQMLGTKGRRKCNSRYSLPVSTLQPDITRLYKPGIHHILAVDPAVPCGTA